MRVVFARKKQKKNPHCKSNIIIEFFSKVKKNYNNTRKSNISDLRQGVLLKQFRTYTSPQVIRVNQTTTVIREHQTLYIRHLEFNLNVTRSAINFFPSRFFFYYFLQGLSFMCFKVYYYYLFLRTASKSLKQTYGKHSEKVSDVA